MMMDASVTIQPGNLNTVILGVRNFAASKDWYINKIGLNVIWEDVENKVIILNTKASVMLTLCEAGKEQFGNKLRRLHPVFKTENIEALRSQLLNNEISTSNIMVEDQQRFFFFFDSDGNVLEACEDV